MQKWYWPDYVCNFSFFMTKYYLYFSWVITLLRDKTKNFDDSVYFCLSQTWLSQCWIYLDFNIGNGKSAEFTLNKLTKSFCLSLIFLLRIFIWLLLALQTWSWSSCTIQHWCAKKSSNLQKKQMNAGLSNFFHTCVCISQIRNRRLWEKVEFCHFKPNTLENAN